MFLRCLLELTQSNLGIDKYKADSNKIQEKRLISKSRLKLVDHQTKTVSIIVHFSTINSVERLCCNEHAMNIYGSIKVVIRSYT